MDVIENTGGRMTNTSASGGGAPTSGGALDPRLPVLVGVGQCQRRPSTDATAQPSPAQMMVDAVRLAADDSGAGDRLLKAADSVRVVDLMSWQYPDPAALVAEAIGASPRERVKTSVGGNTPQMLVNDAAGMIQRGELDVVVITGAEAMYTRMKARKGGGLAKWETQPDGAEPTRRMGVDKPGTNELEMARGLMMPIQLYPIFECAIRAAKGEGVDEHTMRIAELWSRFSEVGARNPNAWSPTALSAEEIATPGPDNRMVGFPYTKWLNSNMQVDQAAALILCSVEAARTAGVPEDRWVFVHSGADATDHWFVSERHDLHSSPAIRACGEASLRLAGIGIDDVAHLDVYSCFTSAVQVGCDALGVDAWDPSRVPTVTGGLVFAGGPGNNYVTHSIATMGDVLRADPGSYGVVTANGWYLTKHAIGVYSTRPPADRFRWESAQPAVDASPRREWVEHEGPVTIEAYTVMHERDGSRLVGLVAALLGDGRRTWANTDDADLMAAMECEELVGRTASIDAHGHLHV